MGAFQRNPGCELDLDLVNNVHVNLTCVNNQAKQLAELRPMKGDYRAAWILKAVTFIDLTTLAGDDTNSNVSRLCLKAARPIAEDLLEKLGFNYEDPDCPIRTAAVCVYPSKVKDATDTLKQIGFYDKINVASVATGFPSGQFPLKTRLEEIRYAVEMGAKEIDIVIDRALAITGRWKELFMEIKQMRKACGSAHLKAILATGELGTLENVYKASLVAMMAGSDFIKTSTGKETVNATLPFGIVMARAIKEYHEKTGYKVGLKPAGGVKTAKDAINWLVLIKELLGDDWLNPELFRFGASGLLTDLEFNLFQYVTGRSPVSWEFSG
ncbi:deoxyribose-phosphate aldolase [Anthonomus grandis grandis]|uniref:deoxyribose-phosphate aldolase n=1 Tax=Anthonomus grandis grandis TaxID=2921223 RepID=UPI0021654A5F|nr:deoxyribose-phosphate aldolase [Anthonomus grandis grandis]